MHRSQLGEVGNRRPYRDRGEAVACAAIVGEVRSCCPAVTVVQLTEVLLQEGQLLRLDLSSDVRFKETISVQHCAAA
eukprot:23067-Rhodomonas_salina.1